MSQIRPDAVLITKDSKAVLLQANHPLLKLRWLSLIVGVVALVLLVVFSRFHAKPHVYFSYLTSYMFWLSIALGGLFFVIIQHATRAGWSIVVRRIAENAMITLPLFAILFLPIVLFGMHHLYHWSHEAAVAHDKVLQAKSGYLNPSFFYLRSAGYFIVWSLLGYRFYRKSLRQDVDGETGHSAGLRKLSAPAIVIFGLTVTFASFDWLMSLDPHWYSTMFGVYFFSGCFVAIIAFLSIVGILLRQSGKLVNIITAEHYHDLGKLLFAFAVFWTYIAFSQYFLYWYANIPEETMWFRHRLHGNWRLLTFILALGHFVVPFFFLMTRKTKRNVNTLLVAAVWMLAVHFIDLYWIVMPTFLKSGFEFSMLDLFSFVGIGGLFVGIFSSRMIAKPLVPVGDPRLQESLSFENF